MILKELSEAMGVSGDEKEVRAIIKKAIASHVDRMWVDNLGNLLAIKNGTGKVAMRVLLDAHMDEVGLMVIGYSKDGSLQFKKVGGIDNRVLLGKTFYVGPDKLPGVIGGKPIHLLEDSEESTVVSSDNLRIDIGASNKEDAAKKVKIGDRAIFATRFIENETTMMGKAFDDRIGCAVLIELLQNGPYPMDVLAAFTVQEEVGLRGAKVASFQLEPDVAFVFEGTICDDMPKKEDEDISPVTEVGKGPAISLMDKTTIADPRLIRFLASTAEKHAIPYQFRRTSRGGTDAGEIHLSKAGVPSVGISMPSRYIHSPASVCSKDDFNNTVRLARAALNDLTPDVIAR